MVPVSGEDVASSLFKEIMMNIAVYDFLTKANSAQSGSYGEYIFARLCADSGMLVESRHRQRHDFLVDGRRVDVKTYRGRIKRDLQCRAVKRVYKRMEGIDYAVVEFCLTGARACYKEQLHWVSWTKLDAMYLDWKSGLGCKTHKLRGPKAITKKREVFEQIYSVFEELNKTRPYMLYRTEMFEGESPHNLLPSQRSVNKQMGWTVFLIFQPGKGPDLENLREIIAFPDSADPVLPRLVKIRTSGNMVGLEKVDLERLPDEYRYASLELLANHLVKT